MLVAGIDGCRIGWVVATANLAPGVEDFQLQVLPTFKDVVELLPHIDVIAVDIPIGLLDRAERGGRLVDRLARQRLPGRTSSVFSAPIRPVLSASTYAEALRLTRASSPDGVGFSKQGWAIVPKIREVDEVRAASGEGRIFEVHPEVCFAAMSGRPMSHNKKNAPGREERLGALRTGLIVLDDSRIRVRGAAADDVIDACAALWTAARIARGEAKRLPDSPPRDSRNQPMEMWY